MSSHNKPIRFNELEIFTMTNDDDVYYVDNRTFKKILSWLDTPTTKEQVDGMNRLRKTLFPWSHD